MDAQKIIGALVGWGVLRTAEAAIASKVAAVPAAVGEYVKGKIQAAAASGRIDGPTTRLAAKLWRAAFEWADEEFPAHVGPAKMDAILDRAASVPYLGLLVQADRAEARAILQTEFDALQTEIRAEKMANAVSDGKA